MLMTRAMVVRSAINCGIRRVGRACCRVSCRAFGRTRWGGRRLFGTIGRSMMIIVARIIVMLRRRRWVEQGVSLRLGDHTIRNRLLHSLSDSTL